MITIDVDGKSYYYKNKFTDLTIEEYLKIVNVNSKMQSKLTKDGVKELSDSECDYAFYIQKQIDIIKIKSNLPTELITTEMYYRLSELDEDVDSVEERLLFSRDGQIGLFECKAPTLDEIPFIQFVDFMSMLSSDNLLQSFSILTATLNLPNTLATPQSHSNQYDSNSAFNNVRMIANLNAAMYIKDFYYYLFEHYRNVLKSNFYYILDAKHTPSSFSSKTSAAASSYYKKYSWYSLLIDLAESGVLGNYYDLIKAPSKLALTVLHIRLGKQYAESEDYKLNNK